MMMRGNLRALAIAGAAIIALVAAVYLAARLAPAVVGQSFTIGYVDMARALDAHPGKASAESAYREYAQAQLADAQQRGKAMAAAQRQDLQRQVEQQILRKRGELLSGLEKDIRAAIQKVAGQQGVAIVLSRDVVLYGGVDLTDQVIKVISGK